VLETRSDHKLVQLLKDFILSKKNHNKVSLEEDIVTGSNENNENDDRIVFL